MAQRTLVIVESPGKTRKINKILGDAYTVRASLGHVRDLPTKAAGGKAKSRSQAPASGARAGAGSGVGLDVSDGWRPSWEIIPGKEDVVRQLEAAGRSGTVYLATDLDREGEAIAWHLADILGGDPSRFRRVTFSEITEAAVLAAFEKPRTVDQALVRAQMARRFLDRIVGYELSPLLCQRLMPGLSAGRVQSAALKVLVDRDERIRTFRHAAPETRKAVYMYALEPAWRARLAAPAPAVAPLAVGDGLDAEVWADHEFGGARLGDARLSARLVQSAQHMAESPMRAITGAAHGARALVKGHYRLIDQPADSAVTVDNILAPHRERTLRRMQAHDTVLCIQDGTRLNFTRRGQTQGLGAIGSNQTGAVARGLELHTTLAVNPDGVALGVLRAAFDAPAPPNPAAEGEPTPKPKPREERKSFRWIEGLRDCAQAAEQLSETRVVCAMDREADFLDLFIARRAHAPQVDLLVRAKVDRVLGKEKTPDGQTVSRHLFDQVRNAPARGDAKVEVQRLSARAKASKQARKDRRAARGAEVTLRYQQVALPCPGAAPVELWVVHVREEQPPPEAEPLEWFLLTTLPVTSPADAMRILQWYALRWRIEEYFRVLKSGCKVEELQHHTAERLERAMAIKMVIGWRIQLMVQLGREVPDLPGDLLFSDGELRVLATFARSRKLPPPARLGDAVGLVARLGGWLGRTRDPPGAQLMWHGYTQLVAMTFGFELRDEFG